MEFDIITYCSRNYTESLEATLNSWKEKSGCSNIVVYSDVDALPFDGITVRKIFDINNNWVENVGRKIIAILDYMRMNPNKYFVFLDADNYVRGDISSSFNGDFEIGLTRMEKIIGILDESSDLTVSAGNIFVKPEKNTIDFFYEWNSLSDQYKQMGRGVVSGATAYEQYALTDLVATSISKYKICPLDRLVYNCETNDSDHEAWISLIKLKNAKIVHLKGGRFRDKVLIKKIDEVFSVNQSHLKDRQWLENILLPSLDSPILFVGVADYTSFYHTLVKSPELFSTIDIDEEKAKFGSPYMHHTRHFLAYCPNFKYRSVVIYGLFGLPHLLNDLLDVSKFLQHASDLVEENGKIVFGSSTQSLSIESLKRQVGIEVDWHSFTPVDEFLIETNSGYPNYVFIGEKR